MRIAAIFACVILLAACGGGKSVAQKRAEFKLAADTAGEMAALQLSDLPEGWAAKPASDPSDEATAAGKEFEACAKFSVDNPATTGVKEIDGTEYKGPPNDTVSADIAVFETQGAAQDALNLVSADFSNCGNVFAAAFRNAATEGFVSAGANRDLLDVRAEFSDGNIPSLGDASKGYRVTLTERTTNIAIYFEFQLVRTGHINALISTLATGTQLGGLDTLPKIVDAKLRAAEATLPK